jgi:hypothetical protein
VNDTSELSKKELELLQWLNQAAMRMIEEEEELKPYKNSTYVVQEKGNVA